MDKCSISSLFDDNSDDELVLHTLLSVAKDMVCERRTFKCQEEAYKVDQSGSRGGK